MHTSFSNGAPSPTTVDPDALIAVSSPAGLAWYADGCNRTRDPARGWLPYPHLTSLSGMLMRVAAGEITRLIVTMPPRHGKSWLVSRAFPAWYLGCWPRRQVMLASNTATLAEGFSRSARDLLVEHGPGLFGVHVRTDSSAVARWQLAEGGIMIAAGVGGPLTGRGAHLLIVDDPIKNSEEAASETIREKQWEWWRGTARTRLMAGGSVVAVATRWNEDDLLGRMLRLAETEPGADQWTVLNLPAVAESDSTGVMNDPLGRAEGEPLCPGLMPLDQLERTRLTLGAYYWSALYQQRPAPAEGLLFKEADFRYWEPTSDPFAVVLHADGGPRTVRLDGGPVVFQTVDVAASEKQTADFTVVATWAVGPGGELILLDRARQRFELLDVGGMVMRCYWQHRPRFVDIESFGHGLSVVQELSRKGVPVRRVQPDKDKVSRALLAVARYEEHRVFHPARAGWLEEWESELLAFPAGAHDDQVDVCSMAAARLPGLLGGDRAPRSGRSTLAGVRDRMM